MLPFVLPALGALGGSALLTKLLNPGKAYKKGAEAMQPYYTQSQQYLQPYQQQGQEAYGRLQNYMNSYENPEELYSRFAGSYQTSPATQMAQERARNSSLDAANAMGLGGATTTARALSAENQRIEADAMERYIDRLINQYGQGATMAQNIYGQGANAAGAMGQNAMNMGQMTGQAVYGERAAPGQMFQNFLGQALGGLGQYYALQAYGKNNAGGSETKGAQPNISTTGTYGGR